jgi:WD40 repeat protein
MLFFSNNDSSNHLTTTNNKGIPVTIVSWSCNDRMVATAYENGLIKVWEPNHGTLVNELKVKFKIERKYNFFFLLSET